MSSITTVVMHLCTLDEPESIKLKQVNKFFEDQGKKGFVSCADESLPDC